MPMLSPSSAKPSTQSTGTTNQPINTFLKLATCPLLLATCYLLFASCYLFPSICYPLFAICYFLYVSCYLVLLLVASDWYMLTSGMGNIIKPRLNKPQKRKLFAVLSLAQLSPSLFWFSIRIFSLLITMLSIYYKNECAIFMQKYILLTGVFSQMWRLVKHTNSQ